MAVKRAFIRVLWGDARCKASRVRKVRQHDIQQHGYHPFDPPFISYVFGRDNYDFLMGLGYQDHEMHILSDRPFLPQCGAANDQCNVGHRGWLHKPHAWQVALSQHYDEIVAMDWDTHALKPINEEHIWSGLGQKAGIQACLARYRTVIKAPWRPIASGQQGLVPSAAFVYLRGTEAVDGIMDILEEYPGWSEEMAMAMHIDSRHDGHLPLSAWSAKYEPFCCIRKASGLPPIEQREPYKYPWFKVPIMRKKADRRRKRKVPRTSET